MNEIEKAFKEEVREKKRTANGVHGKKGKRGYVGPVRTPADLLKGKERRVYEGTSPVRTSRINSVIDPVEIIPHEEFKKLSKRDKTLTLYKLKAKFTAKELSEAWGVSNKNIYYLYRAYGVTRGKPAPVEGVVETSVPNDRSAADAGKPANKEAATGEAADGKARKSTKKTVDHAESGNESMSGECRFVLVGSYGAQSLGKKLNGLAFMLDDKLKYQVEICVREIAES